MKKYLVTGLAAVAISGMFTSCTHDNDSVGGSSDLGVVETYEKAFISRFGTPSPDADWGFGPSTTKAGTRATGEFADHVGAYPDANMWTSKGFLAPDPLTQSQKLRAQYYFQMNKIVNPNRPNYGTKDFFMQQVYTGGTDPMTGKSAEKYKAADNNTMIVGGIHMDHLTVGPDALHTFNFNHGTCSTNDNVANRDQTTVNDAKQQHSDQIQLMLNTPTSCFGYANSEASCVRNDRWTLVSAATIDAFCDGDSNFKTWLASKLNSDEVDKKCDDEFHRDFIGFDFDMLPDNDLYQGTPVDKDGKPVWDLYNHGDEVDHIEYQYFSIDLNGKTQVWDGTKLVDATTIGEFGSDGKFYPYMPGTTLRVHNTNPNGNQYCGTYENNWSDNDWKYTDSQNNVYTNIEKMTQALKAGKLPKGGATKEWIAFGKCNDGYFSDWIVTFMPATSGNEQSEDVVRVIAEDMGDQATNESSDFDFNDVVFDVEYVSASEAKVTILAAGGTLPLTVGWDGDERNESGYIKYEVHNLLGYSETMIINTNSKVGNHIDNVEPKTITVSGSFDKDNLAVGANAIPVKVRKNNKWYTIVAPQGKAAGKLCVGTDYEWCNERQDIYDKWKDNNGALFLQYVNDPNTLTKYWYRLSSNYKK